MKILRVDADERKIGLSRKRVDWAEEERGDAPGGSSGSSGAGGGSAGGTPPSELKGGVGGDSGPLIK